MSKLGPLLLVITTIFYAISHSLVKVLGGEFTVLQLAFTRFIIAPIILVPLIWRQLITIQIHNWSLLLARTFFGVSAMLLYFWALTIGHPGKVSLMFQFSSIWGAVFGALLLNERLSKLSIAAIPVAFIGLTLVIQPSTSFHINLADILALIASLLNAGVYLSLKTLRKDHNTQSIMMANYSLSALILAAPVGVGPTPIFTPINWALLCGVALFGFVGNWLMTIGFKYSSAGISGNIMLLTVPFMYISGILFFNEPLTFWSSIGAVLVLSSISVMIVKK